MAASHDDAVMASKIKYMHLSKLHLHTLHPTLVHWWLVTISCVCVAALVIVAHGARLFTGAFHADEVTGTLNGNVESISRESLSDTISTFETRRRVHESLLAQHGGTSLPTGEGSSE